MSTLVLEAGVNCRIQQIGLIKSWVSFKVCNLQNKISRKHLFHLSTVLMYIKKAT